MARSYALHSVAGSACSSSRSLHATPDVWVALPELHQLQSNDIDHVALPFATHGCDQKCSFLFKSTVDNDSFPRRFVSKKGRVVAQAISACYYMENNLAAEHRLHHPDKQPSVPAHLHQPAPSRLTQHCMLLITGDSLLLFVPHTTRIFITHVKNTSSGQTVADCGTCAPMSQPQSKNACPAASTMMLRLTYPQG